MPANRYYIESPLNTEQITLEGGEHTHLVKVMRQKKGDLVELVNGQGALACASILEIEKKKTLLLLNQIKEFKLSYSVLLIQALPTLSHLEFIAEKGTELGMSELFLFEGDHSQLQLTETKLNRIKLKMIAALKQSGRVYLPKIRIMGKLSSFSLEAEVLCYGDVNPEAPLLNAALPKKEASSYAFVSGPEAGFSTKELQYLQEQQVPGVSVHSNILRTETAPLTYLSLIHNYLRINGNSAIIN